MLESSLGQVPSAAKADTATTRPSADTATSAANADTLDGVDGAQYVRVKTRVRAVSDTTQDANYASNGNLAQLSNLARASTRCSAKLQVDNDGAADELDGL